MVWDKRSVELLGMEVGLFSISCWFRCVDNGFIWVFIGVYGPLSRDGRKQIWEELGDVRGLWGDPWCVGGDFNIIQFPTERNKAGRLDEAMRCFFEVIDELELVDLPLLGGVFTWSGGLGSQDLARLDRFLTSQDWLDFFGSVSLLKMPRPTSDHAPILLDCGGVKRDPAPFRFENMWLKVGEFQDFLREWWQGFSFNVTLSYVLS